MNSSCTRINGHEGHIQDEVTDLSPEDVCCTVGKTVGTIWIAIDQSNARSTEVGECPDCWDTVRVTDDLCVIVVNDVGGYHIGSSREVYNGWRC